MNTKKTTDDKNRLVKVEMFRASDVTWVRAVKWCDVDRDSQGFYVESTYFPIQVWRKRK